MKVPKFAAKSRLVRYVDEINRLSGNRTSAAAFIDPPSDDPSDHLSVNSLEVETLRQIAAYHRWRAQDDRGEVALCEHKVHEYSDAARKSGVSIVFDRDAGTWQFVHSGRMQDAYKHREVRKHDNPLGSPSHCGVEFKRALSQHAAARFARRMGGKKFHSVRD